MVIYTANGIFPGRRLKGKEKYAKLYHYTSLQIFKLIWESKKLKFGLIPNVNDINEVKKIISTPFCGSKNDQSCDQYIKELSVVVNSGWQIIKSYKQISLTKDYDSYMKGCMSPMMWGHYGDKGRGVCIEFDFNKIVLPNRIYCGSVKYRSLLQHTIDFPIGTPSTEEISSSIIKNLDTIFFTKTKDWKGENEFRIVSSEIDFLDIENAISAVYVTDYNSDTCLEVENVVKENVPVKFLHYINTSKGWRIPVLTNTRSYRKQNEEA